MKSRFLVGLGMLALTGCAVGVQAGPAAASASVVPADYEGDLAGHGRWYDDPSYGRVWQPSVAVGWRPYWHGYWGWGNSGWQWTSYEPWGWTFHYGRWGWSAPFGWVWVPGFTWGPAWVQWIDYGGYYGWAPLSPFGGITINHFVFVNQQNFCARDVRYHAVDYHRAPRGVSDHWQRHVVNRIERAPVEHVTQHPIPRVDRVAKESRAPWERRVEVDRPSGRTTGRPGFRDQDRHVVRERPRVDPGPPTYDRRRDGREPIDRGDGWLRNRRVEPRGPSPYETRMGTDRPSIIRRNDVPETFRRRTAPPAVVDPGPSFGGGRDPHERRFQPQMGGVPRVAPPTPTAPSAPAPRMMPAPSFGRQGGSGGRVIQRPMPQVHQRSGQGRNRFERP